MLWLTEEKGIQVSTQRVYRHNLSHFLGFKANTYPEEKAKLSDAWNYDAGKIFLKSISEIVAPSTALGYHNALKNARLFLTCQGNKPPNHKQITTAFAVLARGASTKRTKYIQSTKLAKAKKFKVLGTFYRHVYHSQENWKWYAELVKSF